MLIPAPNQQLVHSFAGNAKTPTLPDDRANRCLRRFKSEMQCRIALFEVAAGRDDNRVDPPPTLRTSE